MGIILLISAFVLVKPLCRNMGKGLCQSFYGNIMTTSVAHLQSLPRLKQNGRVNGASPSISAWGCPVYVSRHNIAAILYSKEQLHCITLLPDPIQRLKHKVLTACVFKICLDLSFCNMLIFFITILRHPDKRLPIDYGLCFVIKVCNDLGFIRKLSDPVVPRPSHSVTLQFLFI